MRTFDRFASRSPAWWYASIIFALLLATTASAETKAAPTATSSIFHACADAMDHTSSSIRDDDGRRTLTVKLDGSRCAIDFRLEGKPVFNEEFTDLVSLSSGGFLRLEVKDDGERRQLEIEQGRDGLKRTWKVNGREQPYDDPAHAWFAAFLIELDRRTAVGVDYRLPVLLRKGGVSAVLDETGRMPGDYARGVYYSKLADARQLSSGDVVRVLDQAASLKTGDYYAAELLKRYAPNGGVEVRSANFRLIQSMSSDYYRAESVKQVAGSGRLGAPEMDLLIGVIQHMQSDYYKTEVLKQVLAGGKLDDSQRKQLALLARDIHADSYAYEFVKALAEPRDMSPSEVQALIDAAATIESDYYLSESTAAILANPSLTEGNLLAIVKITAPSKSDYYRSEMLRRVLAHRAVTDAVRRAALDATDGMSSYYREEVEKASARR